MKIARKLTLVLVAGIVILSVAFAFIRLARERMLFERDVTADAEALGRALAHGVEEAWLTDGEESARAVTRHATYEETGRDIRLIWRDAPRHHPDAPTVPSHRLEPLSRGETVTFSMDDGSATHFTYVPVQLPASEPVLAVEVGDPWIEERAYMGESVRNVTLMTVALVLLCAALVWGSSAVLIGQPLRRLTEQARKIGRGVLDEPLSLARADEVGEVAAAMDAMADDLRTSLAQRDAESEARLTAVEQLRHADRLKTVGTLASGIAHELGTPLNVIEAHAGLIGSDPTSSHEAKDHARIISLQCQRMAQTVRQVLHFARRGEGRSCASDVPTVASDTLRLVAPFLRKRGVEPVLDVEPGSAGLTVDLASGQLHQVLANLVMNGIQAMPDGGHLGIQIGLRRAIRPGGDHEADYVAVSVRDTGVGMDPGTAEHAFEPFFTTKDVGEGTGLGLSVAHGIVDDHAGWIDVQSEVGRGSRFTVFLPKHGGA
jgi:signal transduction histidine kinase